MKAGIYFIPVYKYNYYSDLKIDDTVITEKL